MIAPTATTIAAIINARGGPSPVSASTAQTLRAHSVGDRTGQGAGDTGDLLHARNDVGLQVGEVVAKQLAALPGVLSSEYVTGPYDVVVRIGADDLADLQANVVPSVQQVTGITRTLTCPIANGVRP